MNHQDQKEIGTFLGAKVLRKVVFVVVGYNAAKGWVRQNQVHPVLFGVVAQRLAQTITETDVGHFHVVQNQVGSRQQIRKRFVFPTNNVFGNAFALFNAVGLFFQMLNGGCEVATRSTTGVEYLFAQLWVHHFADKLSNGSWRIELATFTRTLQFL